MKEMSKARIITKRSIKSVMNERQILTQIHNPFIVNMYYAFQDRENLYLVMDLLSGGDLRYHICKYRRFTEEQTRNFFFIFIIFCRIFHCLCSSRSRIYTWKKYNSQRYKAWKSCTRWGRYLFTYQFFQDTFELLILELPESGDLIMLKTLLERQVTWVLHFSSPFFL